MESGSHFQKTEQQIREYAAVFPEMSDTGIQNREHQNITTQSGDRFKTVHNRGIQYGSGRVGGGCLFFCAGYFRHLPCRCLCSSLRTSLRLSHGSKSHFRSLYRSEDQPPGSAVSPHLYQPCQSCIHQFLSDTYLYERAVPRFQDLWNSASFRMADLLSGIEIGSDFCSHGITAEKSEEKSTGTGRGDAEYFT